MAWLAELAPITGARWSAGAVWADSGSPSVDDSDWEDSTTWDAAHAYDPDAALSLGIFVQGLDLTDVVRAASWGLGLSDPAATSSQASSCSLTFRESAEPAVGDRVVILTDWDVLWSGRVEGVAIAENVGERDVVDVSATDDLARAALADAAGRSWGGDAMGLIDTMLLAAGIVGRAYTSAPGVHDPPPYHPDPGQPVPSTWPIIPTVARTGSITPMLSAAAYFLGWLSTYTPAGLRLCNIAREQDLEYPTPVQDLSALRSLSRRHGIESVRNRIEATGWAVAPLTSLLEDADSQAAYGVRTLSIDGSDWFYPAVSSDSPLQWAMNGYSGSALDYFDPVLMLDASARIKSRRHAVARYMPFDYLTVGDPDIDSTTERYRVLRVSHRVSPDDWEVTLEAVAVSSQLAESAAEGGLGKMGLGSEGLGE